MTRRDDELRIRAFRDRKGPEVFRSVAYTQEVWKEDPFDVDSIHAEARSLFGRLVERAGRDPDGVGRILLILGPAGCGKTHLMRAFRTELHAGESGWFGYMQMTTQTSNYERYLLVGTIDALNQPYDRRRGPASGLRRLSDALVALAPDDVQDDLERLAEEEDLNAVAPLAFAVADALFLSVPALGAVDPDLVRALVLLQSTNPLVRGAVLKFLRGERLSPPDRRRIGDLGDRAEPEDAMRFLQGLGHVMALADEGAFVLCVDQLEDLYEDDETATRRFRRAMETITRFAQQVPNAVVVVSCLHDYFFALERHLKASTRDRLVQDPEPVRLRGELDHDEVRAVVAARLRHLFEELDAPFDDSRPLHPFDEADIDALAGLTVRAVLGRCHEAQERSMAEEAAPSVDTASPPPPVPDTGQVEAIAVLERKWNDFRAQGEIDLPEDAAGRAALLARGFRAASRELSHGLAFDAAAEEHYVRVACRRDDYSLEDALVAVCDKSPRGGGLYREVTRVLNEAEEEGRVPVVARSTEFPTNARTRAAQRLGEVVAEGGRRAVVAHETWRDIALLPLFEEAHAEEPALDAWRRWERPLTRLPALQELLDLEGRTAQVAKEARWEREAEAEARSALDDDETEDTPAPAPVAPAPPTAPAAPARPADPPRRDAPAVVHVGQVASRAKAPYDLPEAAFLRHVGVLGQTGSGKTTLALHLLEQLLEAGVPAILLDRKGDLANYALAEAWQGREADPERRRRREWLRDRLDVRLFTPGEPEGRPLVLPVVPRGLASLKGVERTKAARGAASAVAGMLGYRLDGKGQDATRLAILTQAMVVASEAVAEGSPTLDDLVSLVAEQDPALLHAIGKLEPKHCKKLVEHLETLRLNAGALLQEKGETVDLDRWLGRRGPEDRVPLTIVSLGPLGTNDRILFWTARFLMELSRHARRHPADHLQGVVLLDEADLYLPATAKPATKEPLEGALKRFRSAGLGLVLATQNPGDLDYRCRDNVGTWFVGRITQATAIQKLRPLLQESGGDIEGRLAGQEAGAFFALRERAATPIRADRNLLPTRQLPEGDLVAAARGARTSNAATR